MENPQALEWFAQRDKKSLMAGIVYGQGLKGRANILHSLASDGTLSPSGNASGTSDNWEFDKGAFLFGVAVGRSLEGWETDGAGSYIPPPRKRFIALYCDYLTSGIPPLLQSIGYQGAGNLRYGYQIEYDAAPYGGFIEDVGFTTSFAKELGYTDFYYMAVAPYIRGDITGARAIPTFWLSEPSRNAEIVARARAVEFAESDGEWSYQGHRGDIWFDAVQTLGGSPNRFWGAPFHLVNYQ